MPIQFPMNFTPTTFVIANLFDIQHDDEELLKIQSEITSKLQIVEDLYEEGRFQEAIVELKKIRNLIYSYIDNDHDMANALANPRFILPHGAAIEAKLINQGYELMKKFNLTEVPTAIFSTRTGTVPVRSTREILRRDGTITRRVRDARRRPPRDGGR